MQNDRPESELSTISVAELNTVTVHPSQAFQTTSSSTLPTLISTAGNTQPQNPTSTSLQPHYRQHHIDYSQMFQISLAQGTISTNPDDL